MCVMEYRPYEYLTAYLIEVSFSSNFPFFLFSSLVCIHVLFEG